MPGTAYNIILDNLNKDQDFCLLQENKLTPKEYLGRIIQKKANLLKGEFNEDMLNLSARMPSDPDQYVDWILDSLFNNGVISTKEYNKSLFSVTEKFISDNFIHSGKKTFIFPEEARLLFALADICKPEKIAFMGSYYAFWAAWILPVLPQGAKVWLMDIDEECQALAHENISNFNISAEVEVIQINQDAIKSITSILELDWIVLDAEGPKSGVDDEDMIDKAIYYPMIREGYASLRKGGLMIAHNILLENTTDSTYIQKKVLWNEKMFSKFFPFLHKNFQTFLHFESTEGVGIAKK